ncbi:hypothetical protein L227DRAFT_152232 [Lentinus tigrinus ALCF2SS1-6]|uniref:Uncharacterized protein n=1 Tax=Lentinus tigrinus ALCF2SS1-6 TaxID=1328759 RepID=A0A5C2S8S9_9APHY|nr:hypothetical protein L227DRAFT_152232 [Lentinus tigrinus ALCF2SS1-6]
MKMSIGMTPPPNIKFEDGDGEWEDVPDSRLARRESDTSEISSRQFRRSATPSSRPAARRRKPAKTVYIAAQAPTIPRRLTPKPRREPELSVEIDRDQMSSAFIYGIASSVRYFGAVVTHALRLLRRPLGWLLFLWMFSVLLLKISSTLRKAFAPACVLPFITSSSLCRPLVSGDVAPVPQWADYPRLVEIQNSNFEQLLGDTVGGSALTLEIKKAEMATRDLVTLVKYSELQSKDHLAESLLVFVDDAKATGRGLQKLTSKINGAVDKIMAINDHALHLIEGTTHDQPNSLVRVVWPFGTAKPSRDTVVEAFRSSMDVHADEMARLILEVEVSNANLDQLEEDLAVLHELCTREKITLSEKHDELLSQLWTILGGNRGQRRKFSTNFELLKALGEYRKRAAAHVAAAMQTLQAMSEDMEDLRERVAAPEIVGDHIPIEVHMKSIQSGMERLKEQRIRAREREDQLMNKILGVEA